MTEFDDPILRDRLSRYAGAPPDSDAAYVGVQQRVRHVKRRRFAIWSGAAALVIGVGAASALRGPDGAKVTVPTASTPVANTVATSTSTSTTATSTPATTTAAAAVTTTAVASTQPVPPEVTNPAPALGTPDSADVATAPAGAPPTESATGSRPTALPAAGEEHHRSSAGGNVGIRLANGSLSLVSATPNDGYAVLVDDDDSGSRIRVVFERRAAVSMVTATVVDGEVRFRVLERGGDRDNASRNGGGDRDRDRDDDHNHDDRDDDRRDREDDGPDYSRDRGRGGDTDGPDN